jgi:cell division septation protein DedD
LPQLDEVFKEKPLNAAAENQRRLLEFRELRNRIAADRELKAAFGKAQTAGTDLEKRKLLRAYYELYFGKLMAMAKTPELQAYLVAKKNEHLAPLPQPRVRPESVPAVAPAAAPAANVPAPPLPSAATTPEPTSSPSPTPTPALFPLSGPDPFRDR